MLFLHNKGIIHHNIKPGNILVSDGGLEERQRGHQPALKRQLEEEAARKAKAAPAAATMAPAPSTVTKTVEVSSKQGSHAHLVLNAAFL